MIASVIAILLLIAGTTVPLFFPARSRLVASGRLPQGLSAEQVVSLGLEASVDGRTLAARVFARDGSLCVVDMLEGRVLARVAAPKDRPPGKDLRAVEEQGPATYSLLWSDGSLSIVEIVAVRTPGSADKAWSLEGRQRVSAPSGWEPELCAVRRPDGEHLTCVLAGAKRMVLVRQVESENLLGEVTHRDQRIALDHDLPGPVSALALDATGRTVYAGTRDGCLATWKIDDRGRIARQERFPAFRDRRAVTALGLVLGDVTLASGDARGEITAWLPRRYAAASDEKLMAARTWAGPPGPVREILRSERTKSLLALAGDGTAQIYHSTSGRHLLSLRAARPLAQITWSPRGDQVLGLEDDGRLTAWRIDCPHPEVSWGTLFGRVLYEGYDEPAFVWQTTGGEDYEPKISLVPLLFGTIKGTFYALLLAAPLALFGAIYVSHFTTPVFRRLIKPCVEIMAALPSVVIGFLVALWLAPILERDVLAVFAAMVTIPLFLVVFLAAWRLLRRRDWAKRVERGYEFLVVVPVLVFAVLTAIWLVGPLERLLFDGNFKLWLNHVFDARYDQRNSIVISFGLGLAVIPIIFSLSEEALSNVPYSLTAASAALGASRWQTVWRIIIPSASPAIFAAMMIGFGRAVGETMIVLMATGNTPILDVSPFNGMRTLSANIAVEIPEAPVGGTLYRVLFLCAVMLFVLTFLLNTVAEVVRQRLRSRYGRY